MKQILDNKLGAQIAIIWAALCMLFLTVITSSCNKTQKKVQADTQECREPLVCSLVEKYKQDFVSTYGFPLNGDSLHFNIEIHLENQDTILSIYGVPFEAYYEMYDNFCHPRNESVYAFKVEKETIIFYFMEPNHTVFAKKLSEPCKLLDVRDYVLNYFPEGNERLFDVNYFTYVYNPDGSFHLLRKHY